MTDEALQDQHRQFFREVLLRLHCIMSEEYGLKEVAIKPIGGEGARLSIPIIIEGMDEKEERTRYFGKILGSSDVMTERTIQFFKNVFLRMESMEPLFDFTRSAEEMARHQYRLLGEMNALGIPTAMPIGVHHLVGTLWLLLVEYLDIAALPRPEKVSVWQLDTAFGYLSKMHRKGIFHGDIKPENILLGEKVYFMDTGHFLDEAPEVDKKAYDLACLMACLLEYAPPQVVVSTAKRHYSRRDLKRVVRYIELVANRPDIRIDERDKEGLLRLLGA